MSSTPSSVGNRSAWPRFVRCPVKGCYHAGRGYTRVAFRSRYDLVADAQRHGFGMKEARRPGSTRGCGQAQKVGGWVCRRLPAPLQQALVRIERVVGVLVVVGGPGRGYL